MIHGPDGGAGRSTIAVCLALIFAGKGCSTVLVDLSQHGGLNAWLRLPQGASNGFSGMVAALGQERMLEASMRSLLPVPVPGANNQLHLLPSSGAVKMEGIRLEQTLAVINHLATGAQVVVVDTGSELTERVLGAALAASTVLLTMQPGVVSGWQMLKLIEALRTATVSRDRLGLVFSKVERGGLYGVEQHLQALGLPLLGQIPMVTRLKGLGDRSGPPDVWGRHDGSLAIRRLAHALDPVLKPGELKRRWLWSK